MTKDFKQVFRTMNELEEAMNIFIQFAEEMKESNPRYNIEYSTLVVIDVDDNGVEIPILTCGLKFNKINEEVKYL